MTRCELQLTIFEEFKNAPLLTEEEHFLILEDIEQELDEGLKQHFKQVFGKSTEPFTKYRSASKMQRHGANKIRSAKKAAQGVSQAMAHAHAQGKVTPEYATKAARILRRAHAIEKRGHTMVHRGKFIKKARGRQMKIMALSGATALGTVPLPGGLSSGLAVGSRLGRRGVKGMRRKRLA